MRVSRSPRLPERDANIFNGVMRINVQITLGENVHVNHAMSCNLIKHVVEKRQPGIELGLAATVKHQFNGDLRFCGVA